MDSSALDQPLRQMLSICWSGSIYQYRWFDGMAFALP
jgi:hypothetical protein